MRKFVGSFLFSAITTTSPLPALAFDCTTATTNIENTICNSPELKASDDAMENAYFTLRAKLGPIGKKKLLALQRRWLRKRNVDDIAIESTLLEENTNHTQFLNTTPQGMAPHFVYKAPKSGKTGGEQRGYLFADPKTHLEKSFNALILKFAKTYQPGKKVDDAGTQEGTYEADTNFETVSRFDQNILSSSITVVGNFGGAHPFHISSFINIDPQTGNQVKISTLFNPSARAQLINKCADQLIQARGIYDRDDPKLARKAFNDDYPNEVKKHINDAKRWAFEKSGVTITFDEYAVAPYVAGEQLCVFKNAFLTTITKHPNMFK